MTTKAEIETWFDRGVANGAMFLMVVCDTFDWDDYPVFTKTEKEALEKYEEYKDKSMQKIMEVYDLRGDKREQLNEGLVFRLPKASMVPAAPVPPPSPLPPATPVTPVVIGTVEALKVAFETYHDDYCKFELIVQPKNRRADLCAFLMLDELVPGATKMVSASRQEEFFLSIDFEKLATVITGDQVRDLRRCGVRFDSGLGCLCLST